jgi:malate permease and related proteins
MLTNITNVLANISAENIVRIRLAGMFAVLFVGLVAGYLTATRLGLIEQSAKKIMTVVMIFFDGPIVLFVIWQMHLACQLIWMPVIGFCLLVIISFLSAKIFSSLNLEPKARLTMSLAGGLSNLGYTGGAFVCYVLLGTQALALANIYLLLWLPAVYLIFFPMLKSYELKANNPNIEFKFKLSDFMDLRFLALFASILALMLNFANVTEPVFIAKSHIIDILIYTASLLAFFAIGIRVKLSQFGNYINLYFVLAAVKFILTPAIAFLIIWLLAMAGQNLDSLFKKVIMIMAVAPTAVMMVTMSNVFDLDGRLASALWVVNTAIFIFLVVPVLFFASN